MYKAVSMFGETKVYATEPEAKAAMVRKLKRMMATRKATGQLPEYRIVEVAE